MYWTCPSLTWRWRFAVAIRSFARWRLLLGANDDIGGGGFVVALKNLRLSSKSGGQAALGRFGHRALHTSFNFLLACAEVCRSIIGLVG